MLTGSPKLARRERAIEAARRRLRRLEIEQHRIKAALARLEADYEDDVADWLSRKVRRRDPQPGILAHGAPHKVAGSFDTARSTAPFVLDLNPRTAGEDAPCGVRGFEAPRREGAGAEPRRSAAPVFCTDASPIGLKGGAVGRSDGGRRAAGLRRVASPLLCSFVLHGLVLSLCVTFTIATIARQEVSLLSVPANLDESVVEEFSDVEIAPTKFEDAELRTVAAESTEFNVLDRLDEFAPAELGAGSESLGDIGQLDALPSDLGVLMSGAGSPGRGAAGGAMGEAVFFGARSRGERFVFVVDNSSSMKGGRLEAATAELLNATSALAPGQSFYVIFVSDQTYPMFYPQREPDLLPATPANKRRLAEWLPKAILASGNNRKLIEAMDMAAALRPHAVFLLWDGDMKYSEKVRLDVMTHLTRPNQWSFAIHTLGMGVKSLDAEQNLATIAQAHGGTFRRVDVTGSRGR